MLSQFGDTQYTKWTVSVKVALRVMKKTMSDSAASTLIIILKTVHRGSTNVKAILWSRGSDSTLVNAAACDPFKSSPANRSDLPFTPKLAIPHSLHKVRCRMKCLLHSHIATKPIKQLGCYQDCARMWTCTMFWTAIPIHFELFCYAGDLFLPKSQ